ncbi:MAG: hypothetical protein WB766_10310, partial [Roseiarcus sp.]
MAELRNEKTATSETAELDNAELLGFEWLEPERDDEARTEQAIALGACLDNSGLWWRGLSESDSV